MTRILVYLNHLTLYYKRLGPQTEKPYSEFKASPLLYKTHPTFTQANQFTPINQKLIKENNSAKKFRLNYTNRLH
jgi:hypothetical protein